MAQIIVDEATLKAPELWVPGRVPPGRLVPNYDNPLAHSASWGFVFNGARQGGWNKVFLGKATGAVSKTGLTIVKQQWRSAGAAGLGAYAGSSSGDALTRDSNVPMFLSSTGDYKGAFTLLVVAAPVSSSTINTLIQSRVSASPNENVTCTVNRYYAQGASSPTASNGTIYFGTYNATTNLWRGTWHENSIDGAVHAWACSKDESEYLFSLYRDGSLVSSGGTTGLTAEKFCDTDAVFALGGPAETGYTTGSRDPIYMIVEWNFKLQGFQLASLTNDPWQLVRPM